MGYSAEHREKTRKRILESAGRAFRSRGYAEAGIDDIMEGAGLTRGGFYLHFASKEALFAAVVGEELEFTQQIRRVRGLRPDDPEAGALDAIAYYLDPGNRARIAKGCIIVSNAADLARSSPEARRAFTEGFRGLADEFKRLADAPRPGDRALAAIATCVGGVVLARALADRKLIGRLLGACRRAVLRELGRAA